jgi:hypothetical protein
MNSARLIVDVSRVARRLRSAVLLRHPSHQPSRRRGPGARAREQGSFSHLMLQAPSSAGMRLQGPLQCLQKGNSYRKTGRISQDWSKNMASNSRVQFRQTNGQIISDLKVCPGIASAFSEKYGATDMRSSNAKEDINILGQTI